MKNLLAQIEIAPDGGFKGLGTSPLSNPGADASGGVNLFAQFISKIIGVITIIGVIWFIFIFLSGAIGVMSSGGDKNSLESAKKKISTGLIGLVLLIISIFIISLISYLLGFDADYLLNFSLLFGSLE